MPCPFCGHPMEGPLDGQLEMSFPPHLPCHIWVCPRGECRCETVWSPVPPRAEERSLDLQPH